MEEFFNTSENQISKETIDLLSTLKQRDWNDDILIIDGLNTLIRSFSVIKVLNPNGYHVGGLTGFLKSLGFLKRQFNPTRIIIVWDGKGGAGDRKAINSNYKAQRIHSSVIYWDLYDNKSEELQSIEDQAERLTDYLYCLPVAYIRLDRLEADDIIAFIAKSAEKANRHATIVSSDKDFLQLVSSNIDVYSPIKRILYNSEEAFKFLQVLPENYNIAKALLGDKSDNIAGVRGVGTKTLVTLFPKLAQDPSCTLQYVYDTCTQNMGKKAIFAKIINDWNIVETNFKLMDLQQTVLDEEEKKTVYENLHRPLPKLQTGRFLALLDQDKITGITNDTEAWLSQFSSLARQNKV